MTNNLTDKTWCMYTRTFGPVWLTEPQAKLAIKAYKSGVEYIEMDNLLLARNEISGFATGEALRNTEHKRAGDYVCPNHPGNWISKGKTCGYCKY